MLVNVLTVIFVLTGLLAPATQAASLSGSSSFSVSNTPSFSASASVSYSSSGSWSATKSYSASAALSQTASYSNSLTFSGVATFSGTQTFSLVPSGGARPFDNHCPYQSTAICPFWEPHVFSSYRMTVMNSSGFMMTYDNIIVPPTEVPQFPLSYDSTHGFIQPDNTYRFQLFGCTAPGQCVEYWIPQVFTTNPRRRPVCDPLYLCNIRCALIETTLVQCNWTNSAVTPIKRAILRASSAFSFLTFQRIPLLRLRNITARNPRPAPNSLTLRVPINAIVNVQLIARYHPFQPHNAVFRKTFITDPNTTP